MRKVKPMRKPDRYGLEYELQVLIHDTITDKWDVVDCIIFDRVEFPKYPDNFDHDYIFISKFASNYKEIKAKHGLWSERSLLLFYRDVLPKEVSIDLGNIEIKNNSCHHHQTIDSCLVELNEYVDIIGKCLAELLPQSLRFSLMLPTPRLWYYVDLKWVYKHNFSFVSYLSCTKHLNVSYNDETFLQEEASRSLKTFFKDKVVFHDFLLNNYDCLNEDSTRALIKFNKKSCQCKNPFFQIKYGFEKTNTVQRIFQYKIRNERLSFSSMLYDNSLEQTARLHYQLPYDFTDYKKLFNRTLSLQDYQFCLPVVLGFRSKAQKWIRKNPLV